jgi:uncharacterized phage infection (PIP) family protein YhgE
MRRGTENMASKTDTPRSGWPPSGLTNSLFLAIAVVGGFWALADPRGDIAGIKSNYLTIREHDEFKGSMAVEISRLDTEITRVEDEDVTKTDASLAKSAVDNRTADIQRQIDEIVNADDKVSEARSAALDRSASDRSSALEKEFNSSVGALQGQIGELRSRMNDLQEQLNNLRAAPARAPH